MKEKLASVFMALWIKKKKWLNKIYFKGCDIVNRHGLAVPLWFLVFVFTVLRGRRKEPREPWETERGGEGGCSWWNVNQGEDMGYDGSKSVIESRIYERNNLFSWHMRWSLWQSLGAVMQQRGNRKWKLQMTNMDEEDYEDYEGFSEEDYGWSPTDDYEA